jgi:hypothetical protein
MGLQGLTFFSVKTSFSASFRIPQRWSWWSMPVIPELRSLRPEDHESKASLVYSKTVCPLPCKKKKKPHETKPQTKQN